MNSNTLLLGGLSGLLAVALIWQNRSAATEHAAVSSELVKCSNDWKQAVFKLDEQGRLAYTLQTQLKLVQEEHLAVTNELPKVKASLISLQSNHVALTETSKTVSNQLFLQILELKDERGDFEQQLAQLKTALASTETELQQMSRQISNSVSQTAAVSNAWQRVEVEKARLESQLRDPVLLAAQLARNQEASKGKARAEVDPNAERLRIRLLPDGSVKQVP